MYSNMISALVEHGRIETTETKAKALRGMAERAVTRASALGDLLLKDRAELSAEEKNKLVHAIRMVSRTVRDRQAVQRIFDDWAPRYIGRPGGYTRVLKLGYRTGDCAPLALIEFVEAEHPRGESTGSDATEGGEEKAPKKKGWFKRDKAADAAQP